MSEAKFDFLQPDKVFVIAEAGVNHNGDLALAEKLVDAAAAAGCDAVKFQTFRAEEIAAETAALAPYQAKAKAGRDQRSMLSRLELNENAHLRLQSRSRKAGIEFLSTAFDASSADFLDKIGMPIFKIASGEITHKSLVEHVARKGKPLIVSTGMCDLDEVGRAVGWIKTLSSAPLALLHCLTEYPAPIEEVNLRAMDALGKSFGAPVGYSDHTLGTEVAVAAAARGAAVIEKHLTLDRRMPGPDHAASLEPGEFKEMVRQIRSVCLALGDGIKRPAPCEEKNRAAARRSLVAASDLPAGHVLRPEDLLAKRPGDGLCAARLDETAGRKLKRALKKDEKITDDLLL